MESEMLSPHLASVYLGLSRGSIYRLIREGKLSAIRNGRGYRIPREALDPLIATHGGEEAVRERLFDRVLAIANRNPDVDGDVLLEVLEREDAERRAARQAVAHAG